MYRKMFYLLFLVVVLWPTTGILAVEIDARFNPICFTKDECKSTRETFGADKNNSDIGWIKEDPCSKTEGYGKCLPAGITETQIKFGGQTKFKDLGEFFKVNYNYILGIAGILATFMIIIGAAQYVTSGGSSEAIGSAKKRIAGALIGLLIAYLSFVILTTINPALTNLRLPQVFMIKSYKLTPQYCINATGSSQTDGFARGGNVGADTENVDLSKLVWDLKFDKKSFECGKQYFMANAGKSTCNGTACSVKNQVCVNKNGGYSCVNGLITGTVTHNSLQSQLLPDAITEEWVNPVIDIGETELMAVCVNGDYSLVSEDDTGEEISPKKQSYVINGDLSKANMKFLECGEKGGLKGFVLVFEMNENWDGVDEDHYIGVSNKVGVDIGDKEGFEDIIKEIATEHLIGIDQIANGINLDLEAASVIDIDNGENEELRKRKSVESLKGGSKEPLPIESYFKYNFLNSAESKNGLCSDKNSSLDIIKKLFSTLGGSKNTPDEIYQKLYNENCKSK